MKYSACMTALGIVLCASRALCASGADSQTFKTLIQFSGTSGAALGANPNGSLTLSGTTLYGTTALGGTNNDGSVFSIGIDGTSYQNLLSFTGTGGAASGAFPGDSLTLSGTTFYGMTSSGGANGLGNVFSVGVDGTNHQDLVSFTGFSGTASGSYPGGSLALSGTTLYGMTEQGGAYSAGTVFSVGTVGTNYQNLVTFTRSSGTAIGGMPGRSLTVSGTQLYGMTSEDGLGSGYGTIYVVGTGGTNYKSLLSFGGTISGRYPYGSLTLDGTTLYGMTVYGGKDGYGNIFSVGMDGTSYQDLLSFTGTGGPACGAYPYDSLILSGNTFYGTTTQGGVRGFGSIFSVGIDGSDFQNLYSFTGGTDGAAPAGDLTLSGGTLFGTASQCGDPSFFNNGYGGGTVFALALPTPTPEPSTLALVGAAAVVIAAYRWRRTLVLRPGEVCSEGSPLEAVDCRSHEAASSNLIRAPLVFERLAIDGIGFVRIRYTGIFKEKPMNLRTLVLVLCFVLFARQAQANIYEWAISGGSVVQSPTLCPGGSGVSAAPGAYLTYLNLTQAYLINANLSNANLEYATLTNASLTGANLSNANLSYGTLTGANLTGANLSNAFLYSATLTNANFTNATVTGGSFGTTSLTSSQLYSTASYQAGNLQGIDLDSNNMTGWNLSGQNLTNANLIWVTVTNANLTGANLSNANLGGGTLTNANFTNATVTGANFGYTSLTSSQLYSTANYQAGNLQGIGLGSNNMTGWNLSGQNLSNAFLYSVTLTNASLTGANLSNAFLFSVSLTNASLTGANLSNANLSYGTLTGANLTGVNLSNANLSYGTLTGANLTGANLSNAFLYSATLTNANFTNATVTWAFFGSTSLTSSQLYSTANYQAGNLQGIGLDSNNMTGWNLSGQNLSNAGLSYGTLTNANLTGAKLSNAYLYSVTLTTANLTGANLSAANLEYATLTNANLTGANLSNASLSSATLTSANLTGADMRGATGLSASAANATTNNTILPNGDVEGLTLNASNPSLVVRNYAGGIPVQIQQGMTMTASGSLVLEFDGNPWGSTISFDSGIPVTLGGDLELDLVAGASAAGLESDSFQVFNWAGVSPSGRFSEITDNLPAGYSWDTTRLYTTGTVTLVPEPSTFALLAVGVLALLAYAWRRRKQTA